MGLKGDYYHPYVGRVYPTGHTEVLSMAYETFSNPTALLDFMEKAPDHFYLALACHPTARPGGPIDLQDPLVWSGK